MWGESRTSTRTHTHTGTRAQTSHIHTNTQCKPVTLRVNWIDDAIKVADEPPPPLSLSLRDRGDTSRGRSVRAPDEPPAATRYRREELPSRGLVSRTEQPGGPRLAPEETLTVHTRTAAARGRTAVTAVRTRETGGHSPEQRVHICGMTPRTSVTLSLLQSAQHEVWSKAKCNSPRRLAAEPSWDTGTIEFRQMEPDPPWAPRADGQPPRANGSERCAPRRPIASPAQSWRRVGGAGGDIMC